MQTYSERRFDIGHHRVLHLGHCARTYDRGRCVETLRPRCCILLRKYSVQLYRRGVGKTVNSVHLLRRAMLELCEREKLRTELLDAQIKRVELRAVRGQVLQAWKWVLEFETGRIWTQEKREFQRTNLTWSPRRRQARCTFEERACLAELREDAIGLPLPARTSAIEEGAQRTGAAKVVIKCVLLCTFVSGYGLAGVDRVHARVRIAPCQAATACQPASGYRQHR
jgi:hypothetical protein